MPFVADQAERSPDSKPSAKIKSEGGGGSGSAMSGSGPIDWPGVETNVPLMLTQVNAGRLTLNRYVKVQAEGPARAWNLWPRKGNLDRGADADVTIVDLTKESVIDRARLHSKSKLTPFHGWRVKGMPVYTIIRGSVVVKNGEIYGTPSGEHIKPIV